MATKNKKSNENLPAEYAAKLESLPETVGAVAVAGNQASGKEYAPRNIKYVGRVRTDPKTGKLLQNDFPITKTSGADRIELPPASEQIEKRIFFHDRAGDIVRLFPWLYKLITKKGRRRR